jgi:hypothetical protein
MQVCCINLLWFSPLYRESPIDLSVGSYEGLCRRYQPHSTLALQATDSRLGRNANAVLLLLL